MIQTATFRGHAFKVCMGTTHPAYSLAIFSEGGEEYDFREKYWTVQPGEVVVDVGASYGAYTLTALAAGAAKVWAFEPEPTIAPDLRRNLEANQEWEGRWSVYQIALSSAQGPGALVDMRTYAPHWPQQTISGAYAAVALDSIEAIEGRLGRDALLRLDWLKIDVEGHEPEVLRGAAETIRRFKPTIILEVHTFLDATLLDRCVALLKECGYDGFEFVEREPCVMVIAKELK